jgi:1,4-alpha-glucan branching enzyme
MQYQIFEYDPSLVPFAKDIDQRMKNYARKKKELVGVDGYLRDFANGHEYFGFHKMKNGWIYREWAPAAEEVYLTGDMVQWRWLDLKLTSIGNGVFEIFLIKGVDAVADVAKTVPMLLKKEYDGDKVRLLHTTKAVIECEEGPDWCTDGEYAGKITRAELECLEGAVRILI